MGRRAVQPAAVLCPGPVGTAGRGVPASDSPVVSQSRGQKGSQVAIGGKASLELAGSAPARVPGFSGRPSGELDWGGQGLGCPELPSLTVCVPGPREQGLWTLPRAELQCEVARWQQWSCLWGCDPKCLFSGLGVWLLVREGVWAEGSSALLQQGCFHPKLPTARPTEPHGGGALLPALGVSGQAPPRSGPQDCFTELQ